jgi:hypothetical protein
MIREVILQNFRADIAEKALAWVARSEDCDQALMACLKKFTPSGSKCRVPAAPTTGPLKSPALSHLAGVTSSKCELVHKRSYSCVRGLRSRAHTAGADFKPAALARRVFFFALPGRADC